MTFLFRSSRRLALVVLLLAAALGAAQERKVDPEIVNMCTAERGEFAPESTPAAPVLRFLITAMQGSAWSRIDQKGRGFLYFSRDRIWYQRVGTQAPELSHSRQELSNAKQWTVLGKKYNLGEFNFRGSGKWLFGQILCTYYVEGVELDAYDARISADILEAANSFETAVARVKAMPPSERKWAPAPPAPVAPPPPAVGSLKVYTVPASAQVYVDDVYKGTSSAAEGVLVVGDLKPGSYRIRVSNTGFKDWTATRALGSGETAEVRATLESAGPKPLSVGDVEEALRNAIPRARISQLVERYGVDFSLTVEIEARLRSAGADDSLLLAVAKAKK
ncbi:MAG TPA: PEGA domain-containing protein [Terriglobales bacterium]|nr:PEGA domain-containing protein [Terriglobales bacterium]